MNDNQVTGDPKVETDFTTETQEGKSSFSQDDVDRIVKERLSRERAKIMKQYDGVDVEKYREFLNKEEQLRLEQEKARGNFEKVLQETVSKKDSHINQLQRELESIKVDGSLLNAASTRRAVNPQQVVKLLKDQIRLGDAGQVEVLDSQGNVRYREDGQQMSGEDLVHEFLKANPHFVSAGPTGSGSQGAIGNTNVQQAGKVDLSKLNMNDPGDRAIYKKHMKSLGIHF